MNMYVSNLGAETNDETLRTLFAPFGKVTSAKVITDRDTGYSRGFGFVEMESDTDGETAIRSLNQKMIDGKAINVSVAKPKVPANNNGRGR